MELKFKNVNHQNFYLINVEKTNRSKDPYRKALFYVLGLINETRNNINSLDNFDEKCIEFDGLNQPWQTGTSMRVTKLAFNLFNGFNGDIGEDKPIDNMSDYTPYNLFDNGLMVYMLEGIKILYEVYVKDIE
jgi:hypothetical protein